MMILYTSDIHVNPRHLDRFFSAVEQLGVSAAIIGGDLIPARGWSVAGSIASQRQWVCDRMLPRFAAFHKKFPEVAFFMDFGNDDLTASRPLLEARDQQDFHLIHNKAMPIDHSLAIAGYMVVPPTPFKLKDWEKCDCIDRPGLEHAQASGAKTQTGAGAPYTLNISHGTIEKDLSLLSQALERPPWQHMPFVFVAHSPPINTALDCIRGGGHVGSLAIRRFIEHWGPSHRLIASFHGHIHESPHISGRVYDHVNGVLSFNAGQDTDAFRALLFDPNDMRSSVQLVLVQDGDDQEHALQLKDINID